MCMVRILCFNFSRGFYLSLYVLSSLVANTLAMERWMSRFDEKRTQAAETRLKKSSSYKQSAALKAQVASDLQGTGSLLAGSHSQP